MASLRTVSKCLLPAVRAALGPMQGVAGTSRDFCDFVDDNNAHTATHAHTPTQAHTATHAHTPTHAHSKIHAHTPTHAHVSDYPEGTMETEAAFVKSAKAMAEAIKTQQQLQQKLGSIRLEDLEFRKGPATWGLAQGDMEMANRDMETANRDMETALGKVMSGMKASDLEYDQSSTGALLMETETANAMNETVREKLGSILAKDLACENTDGLAMATEQAAATGEAVRNVLGSIKPDDLKYQHQPLETWVQDTARGDIETARGDVKTLDVLAPHMKEVAPSLEAQVAEIEAQVDLAVEAALMPPADMEKAPGDMETAPGDMETAPGDMETAPRDMETLSGDMETASGVMETSEERAAMDSWAGVRAAWEAGCERPVEKSVYVEPSARGWQPSLHIQTPFEGPCPVDVVYSGPPREVFGHKLVRGDIIRDGRVYVPNESGSFEVPGAGPLIPKLNHFFASMVQGMDLSTDVHFEVPKAVANGVMMTGAELDQVLRLSGESFAAACAPGKAEDYLVAKWAMHKTAATLSPVEIKGNPDDAEPIIGYALMRPVENPQVADAIVKKIGRKQYKLKKEVVTDAVVSEALRNSVMIDQLCVQQHFRNRGLGSALLSQAMKKATEEHRDAIYACAPAHNTRVVHLYHENNFEIIGKVKDMYMTPGGKALKGYIFRWRNPSGQSHLDDTLGKL